jgi:hypothetical protein
VSELSKIVNVVLIGLHIEAKVHSGQLVHLAHVYIKTKIISTKVGIFLAVLLHSTLELIEFLLSFKDINLFGLDLFCLYLLKRRNGSSTV